MRVYILNSVSYFCIDKTQVIYHGDILPEHISSGFESTSNYIKNMGFWINRVKDITIVYDDSESIASLKNISPIIIKYNRNLLINNILDI